MVETSSNVSHSSARTIPILLTRQNNSNILVDLCYAHTSFNLIPFWNISNGVKHFFFLFLEETSCISQGSCIEFVTRSSHSFTEFEVVKFKKLNRKPSTGNESNDNELLLFYWCKKSNGVNMMRQ